MKAMDKKLAEMEKAMKTLSVTPTMMCIGEFSCLKGNIVSLDLTGTKIRTIEKFSFCDCCQLISARLPSCLEEICEGAFQYCENLKQIRFGTCSNLRTIKSRAFYGCSELELLDLPPFLEKIGEQAFFDCINIGYNLNKKRFSTYGDYKRIQAIDLRDTKVQHIGPLAFYSCYLYSIYFPSTVTAKSIIDNISQKIDVSENNRYIQKDEDDNYYSFNTIIYGNKSKKHVLIRRGIERIAKKCFRESSIVSVTIPASVVTICENAFSSSDLSQTLKNVRFAKNSRLSEIEHGAFSCCYSLRKISLPSSLKVLRSCSFLSCYNLKKVVFPTDSQLEIIEDAFPDTRIKNLSLPSSLKVIGCISSDMRKLVSLHISNEYYTSNEEGTAIFSKDLSELFHVKCNLKHFDIPATVRVIKRKAFKKSSISGRIVIPSSVEIIEDKAFRASQELEIIEFEEKSRLKSLGLDSLPELKDLIINNDHFKKRKDGVVFSTCPCGIVFVPGKLRDLDVDSGTEVIYSFAFFCSNIKSLSFPRSLKKIGIYAFRNSKLESIKFEEGTELDYIGEYSISSNNISHLKLPQIKEKIGYKSVSCSKTLELPPNFKPKIIKNSNFSEFKRIICPRTSLPSLYLLFDKFKDVQIEIIEDE